MEPEELVVKETYQVDIGEFLRSMEETASGRMIFILFSGLSVESDAFFDFQTQETAMHSWNGLHQDLNLLCFRYGGVAHVAS